MPALPTRFAAVLSALALAGGVAACGEKDEAEPAPPTGATQAETTTAPDEEGDGAGNGQGGGSTPEQKITHALETVIGGGDPGLVCGELVTERYIKQAYGDVGGCRAAASAQGSFAVAVEGVEIQGDAATATAEPAGGPNEGETIRSELVLEDGTWKVDSALSDAPAGP